MIGVFDSGVGGMTVARAIEQTLPDLPLIYFGDLARTPYGSKSSQAICRYSLENTEFLISRGAKIIVIACNSAASVAADVIRSRFDIPVFEVISPAIDLAVRHSSKGRIGVIGTRATIASGVYQRLIRENRPDFAVYGQPCPLLVPLVEEGWLRRRETKMILRRYLAPLRRRQVDTLVLGCTHYPLLADLIRPRIGRKVKVVDSSLAVADLLAEYLAHHPHIKESLAVRAENRYYVSDLPPMAGAIATAIFGRPVRLEKIS